MKELVVISGKGGTGKTSLMAALAVLAENKVLCDADVDAADLHLLMAPQVRVRHTFKGGGVALIDTERCTQCGVCREMCRFEAIGEDFAVDEIACEGCGVCVDFCPEQAIAFPIKTCGEWYESETRFGPMIHARLGIAEENSGKLVTMVRQEARKLGQGRGLKLILTDGPPGVGCPVIASIGGAAGTLIVTEPTVSGKHDLMRVAQLAEHFSVPAMVCVNKFDLNPEQTAEIEALARRHRMALVGRIPFDPAFTTAMVQGKTLFEYQKGSPAAKAIDALWRQIAGQMGINGAAASA
jgi:MinD superfamily P-loop ATPase